MKNNAELIKKLAELTDDELQQAAGGRGESSTLDDIINAVVRWLDAHPNATKHDVYDILNLKLDAYADELTEEEKETLRQLLNSFAS